MKTFIALSAIVLSLFAGHSSQAANQCSLLYRQIAEDAPARNISTARNAVEKLKAVEFTANEARAIKELVKSLGISTVTDMNQLSTAIREKITPGVRDPLKRSNSYSLLGQKIFDVLETRLTDFLSENNIRRSADEIYNLDKNQMLEIVREQNRELGEAKQKKLAEKLLAEYNDIKLMLLRAKFALAENISKIEQFDISEYQETSETPLTTPGYTIVSLSEYPKFAMALAKNQAPPKSYGTGGVLSYAEYRAIVSSNMWLFTLQGHDLKHIHFANAHPMATATLFRTTRSRNHIRYVLIAGCFEGVDTVQYSWESSLARHFSSKGYSLEQAMLEIATMSNAQLKSLAEKVGISAEVFDGWRPAKVTSRLPENVSKPEEYENDIARFVAKSLADLMNPRVNIYMRPELIPDDIAVPAGTSMKPGEIIHHW